MQYEYFFVLMKIFEICCKFVLLTNLFHVYGGKFVLLKKFVVCGSEILTR